MIFFLKKERFNLHKKKVYIAFDKKLNKKEKKLFQFLLDQFKLKKETFLELKREKVLNHLKVKEERLEKIILSLEGKRVNYKITEGKKNIIQGNFSIMNSFAKQDNSYIFLLSEEVRMSFIEKNFFNRIHLTSVLNFSTSYASDFYLNYLMKLGRNVDYTLELQLLKEVLGIEDNAYTRFYDFEKNILKPLLDDINNYTEYYITYEKLRQNSHNKIDAIKFKGINKYAKYTKKKTNELLYLVRDYVDDFELVYEEIYINIMRKGYNYVYNNLIYTKENFTENFALTFQNSLIENPTKSPVEKEIDMVDLDKLI